MAALLAAIAAVIWSRIGAPTEALGAADNGRRLSLKIGDTIEIRLRDNASTGYQWVVETADPALLQLLEQSSHYPAMAPPGTPGEVIFRYRIVGAGSGTLSLKHTRHPSRADAIAGRFAVTIDVVP